MVSNVECKTSTTGHSYLFYMVGSAETGGEQWLSDGTPEGTRPVKTPSGEKTEL
jgi:ELWxxDGT repeat protein